MRITRTLGFHGSRAIPCVASSIQPEWLHEWNVQRSAAQRSAVLRAITHGNTTPWPWDEDEPVVRHIWESDYMPFHQLRSSQISSKAM